MTRQAYLKMPWGRHPLYKPRQRGENQFRASTNFLAGNP